MKQVAGRLRLDLAQYRELEAFAEFGSELDKASQQQLARGARVVEVLKQPQYEPMPVERQVISVYAVTGGYLDDVSLEDCKRFEAELLDFVATRHREIAEHIRDKGDLPGEIETKLKEAILAFKEIFAPSGGRAGSAAAIGAPTPPDQVKPDVGWDRMSSVDEDEEEKG
jgi:F-type H+-transporting ATPase subunit alpha